MALAMVIPLGLTEASLTRSFYCWRNRRGREVSAVTRWFLRRRSARDGAPGSRAGAKTTALTLDLLLTGQRLNLLNDQSARTSPLKDLPGDSDLLFGEGH